MMQHADNPTSGKPFDPDDFETIISEHIGLVYHMARRQLADANLAEDAVQAVFVTLWQRRKRVASDSRFIGGWLMRTTYYVCREINKSERRQLCG